jgi:hypothetical protein
LLKEFDKEKLEIVNDYEKQVEHLKENLSNLNQEISIIREKYKDSALDVNLQNRRIENLERSNQLLNKEINDCKE